MRRQIEEQTARKLCLPVIGSREFRFTGSRTGKNVDTDEITELPRRQQLTGALHDRIEPTIVIDGEQPAGAPCRSDHGVRLVDREAHGFLDQHIQTCLEQLNRHARMCRRRCQQMKVGTCQRPVKVSRACGFRSQAPMNSTSGIPRK